MSLAGCQINPIPDTKITMYNNGQPKNSLDFAESLRIVRKRLPIWFLPIISDCVIDPTDSQWSLFFPNFKLLGLGRLFGLVHFGAFGVFSADLSAPILVLWVPCPCYLLMNHYFYKKLSLYIQNPNIYFELGFDFGPQRFKDLPIVCP